jgi:hypothetical protein
MNLKSFLSFPIKVHRNFIIFQLLFHNLVQVYNHNCGSVLNIYTNPLLNIPLNQDMHAYLPLSIDLGPLWSLFETHGSPFSIDLIPSMIQQFTIDLDSTSFHDISFGGITIIYHATKVVLI